MTFFRSIQAFFFTKQTANGFGLMRIAWAVVTGAFLLMQWKDVALYYSDIGLLPPELIPTITRSGFRFTILTWVGTPDAVFSLYILLLLCLLSMALGIFPRIMTWASVLLLFSFHERNPMVLGGGDTLLRNIGFLLMIAPNISAFSLKRASQQWQSWRTTRKWLPDATMSAWPYRLLLWQMIVLYGTSLWYKLLGTMWIAGTAVESALHHPVFVRWPLWLIDYLMPMAPLVDWASLTWEALWILLLVPRWFTQLLPKPLQKIRLKRLLIIGGILFHGGIFILMDAGVFSLAIFTAYLGLLRDDDFQWLRKIFTKKQSSIPNSEFRIHNSVFVLYDGHCGLCLRSVCILHLCDWLDRLSLVDFRNREKAKQIAPDVTENALDKSMHIKLPNGSYRTGFDAFRTLTWKLPPLWIVAPFLYLPGIPQVGRKAYASIAERRKKCTHETCTVR